MYLNLCNWDGSWYDIFDFIYCSKINLLPNFQQHEGLTTSTFTNFKNKIIIKFIQSLNDGTRDLTLN